MYQAYDTVKLHRFVQQLVSKRRNVYSNLFKGIKLITHLRSSLMKFNDWSVDFQISMTSQHSFRCLRQ